MIKIKGNSPFQTYDGQELYPNVQKTACLCYSLVNNHVFIDGDKRIWILVMLIFLEINGADIECTDEDLLELGLGIAAGEISQEMVLKWISDHIYIFIVLNDSLYLYSGSIRL